MRAVIGSPRTGQIGRGSATFEATKPYTGAVPGISRDLAST